MNYDPSSLELPVVAEGEGWVAVDKPSGLLSVPGRGEHLRDCVTDRIRARYDVTDDTNGIVHRLDMDTSGLMLVALDRATQRALSMQFEARTVTKRYVALLDGLLDADEGELELRHRVDLDDRPRQILDEEHGKLSITRWRRVAASEQHTLVHFLPLTGRSHQLRVAAAHGLGHPILGDRLYGRADSAPRLMLHAERLAFDQPGSGARVELEVAAPFDSAGSGGETHLQ